MKNLKRNSVISGLGGVEGTNEGLNYFRGLLCHILRRNQENEEELEGD